MLRWISCVVLSHVYFVLLYLLPKDGGGGSTYVSRKRYDCYSDVFAYQS